MPHNVSLCQTLHVSIFNYIGFSLSYLISYYFVIVWACIKNKKKTKTIPNKKKNKNKQPMYELINDGF